MSTTSKESIAVFGISYIYLVVVGRSICVGSSRLRERTGFGAKNEDILFASAE